MKRFTEYLNEDFDPAVFNADGGISIKDPSVVDAINSNLELSTGCDCRTPYIALEEVRKILAYYKVFLPKSIFLDQNHGNDVFEVSQFGEKMGMNDQGEVVSASDSPLFVYFEWSLNEKGMYDTFACLCDQEELDEILADFDSEVESDEDLQEEHSMGSNSKMLYKLVNKMKSEKQSDDVDSYIEHEKQGKTFTQMNEGLMPDLKKKMGAKKVTFPNMMKKEETVNEIADTSRGKEAVRRVIHRADATAVDSAINPPRSKKGRREAKNAMKTIDRGIKVHKKQGGVLDNYLKRSYGIKNEESINELAPATLASYIKKASHDVATKSAATGRYADRANKARDKMKKGDYSDWQQGKKDDEFADKMFKKSWNRRKGIAKAADKLAKEETLNELRGKGSVNKDDMKDHIMKKHGEAWLKTREKRKKNRSSGPTDTRDEDKHRNRLGKMYKKLGEEKQTYDTAKAFADIPAKETKTPATSAYRAARKLARKAKERAKDKKK